MREQTFEARFGELRSLLSGEVGQAGFDAVAGVLSSMARQDPARFEAEVLYYTRTALERWYAPLTDENWTMGPQLTGRVAEAAVAQGAAWLAVVRTLELQELKRAALGEALARCERLERLEVLKVWSAALPADVMARLLDAPWMGQLAGINLASAKLGDALGVWRERPAARLRWLELSHATLTQASMDGIAALPGLEVLRIGWSGHTDDVLARLLRMGRWERLRGLTIGESLAGTGCGRATAEALASARWARGLERLDVGNPRWSAATIDEVLAALPGLRQLSVSAAMGQGWRIDETLRRLPQLVRLSLSPAEVGGPLEGGEALEVLGLHGCDAATAEALAGARLERLHTLSLHLQRGAEEAMAETLARGAGSSGVRRAEIGGALTAAQLERMLSGEWTRGVEELRLWSVWTMDEAMLHVLLGARERLPALRALRVCSNVEARARELFAGTWLERTLEELSYVW
jgi:hypothetical protein